MHRIFFLTISLVGFIAFFRIGLAGAQDVADLVTVSGLARQAAENNPRIQAARKKYDAAQKEVKESVFLQDPKFSVGYFGQSVETRVGPQVAKYSISQKFPFWGTLTLKERVAVKKADIAEQQYQATQREVIKDVKDTAYDLYWIRKSTSITKEVKQLLSQLEKSAESKYKTGSVSQQDVMKAQVEISKLMAKLYTLSQQEDTLQEKLNALLNRPVDTPVGQMAEIQPRKFSWALSELQDFAQNHRQELKAAALDIEKNTNEVNLKKKEYFPNVTLGVDYIEIGSGHTTSPDDGQDAWMGMVSVNIPIWHGRIKADVDKAKDQLSASQHMYEDVENQVAFQIKDQWFQLKTAEELVNVYHNGMVPQAEEALKASRAGYETGKADFLNLIDSERVLLNFKIAFYKALTDYEKAVANLERAVGVDFDEIEGGQNEK